MASAVTCKPTLVKIETDTPKVLAARSAYPSELSALSEGTPISAHPLSARAVPLTAPIIPPGAYTEFLRAISATSPTVISRPRTGSPGQAFVSRLQSASSGSGSGIGIGSSGGGGSSSSSTITTTTTTTTTSVPASPPLPHDHSCKCEQLPPHKRAYADAAGDDEETGVDDEETETQGDSDSDDFSVTSTEDGSDDDYEMVTAAESEIARRRDRLTPLPEETEEEAATGAVAGWDTPVTPQPRSAPARPTSFPSLKIPPSPGLESGGTSPGPGSPFSATFSATSPSFPYSLEMAKMKSKWDPAVRPNSRTVRYRSVVTRTITFTPRLSPVPKNKRRKVE